MAFPSWVRPHNFCSRTRCCWRDVWRWCCMPVMRCEREQARDQSDERRSLDIGVGIVPTGGHDEPSAVALALPEQAHRQHAIFRPALVAEIIPVGCGDGADAIV